MSVLKASLLFVPAMEIDFRTTLGQISENKSYNGTSYLSWGKNVPVVIHSFLNSPGLWLGGIAQMLICC